MKNKPKKMKTVGEKTLFGNFQGPMFKAKEIAKTIYCI